MLTSAQILQYLATQQAVLTNSHFVFTSGSHGTAYINMRATAHDAFWIQLPENAGYPVAP